MRRTLSLVLFGAAVLAVALLGGQRAVVVELAVVSAWALILSRILFGGMPRPPFAYRKRGSHWREKWKSMSEEERARYREAWRNRCKPGKDKPEEEV